MGEFSNDRRSSVYSKVYQVHTVIKSSVVIDDKPHRQSIKFYTHTLSHRHPSISSCFETFLLHHPTSSQSFKLSIDVPSATALQSISLLGHHHHPRDRYPSRVDISLSLPPSLPSLVSVANTVPTIRLQPSLSELVSMMKVKNKLRKQSKVDDRRPSRRQSVFSIASSYFGPTALGDDIDIDRTISPALQTSHIFIHEDGFDAASGRSPSRSPFSLSAVPPADNTSPTSQPLHPPAPPHGIDLPSLSSPDHPSPPVPSLATSAQLTPALSAQSDTNGTISPSNANTDSARQSRRPSSFFRSSSISFMGRVHDLPSRLFKKEKNIPKDTKQLRSTCKITEAQISPPSPSKRRPTKSEKAALKRKKSADKYTQKQTKKRLRQFKREMKRRMDESPEGKEAKKRMNKTEKLLKVMDDAKEKFWEWVDRRDEKRRKKQVRAYTEMREERRKSVLLVPVDRDYEVLSRRESRRYSTLSSNSEFSTRTGSIVI
ncbi:hypothetical protein TWF694_010145 [Orbilia ellipsospora]|uniref:Uncharacterized protein n=1 Tax=Orbilia ellipsospora TaxID=2528407 RepID=A0AAV9XAD2_9PEZI